MRVSDNEPEYDPDLDDEMEVDTTNGETPQYESVGGGTREFHDIPDGWTTPAGFVKVLKEQRDVDVRGPSLYATAKNNASFPAKRHTDGRIILNIDEALTWWDSRKQRTSTRGPVSMDPTAYEKAQAAKNKQSA
jgi:rubredoxin